MRNGTRAGPAQARTAPPALAATVKARCKELRNIHEVNVLQLKAIKEIAELLDRIKYIKLQVENRSRKINQIIRKRILFLVEKRGYIIKYLRLKIRSFTYENKIDRYS